LELGNTTLLVKVAVGRKTAENSTQREKKPK